MLDECEHLEECRASQIVLYHMDRCPGCEEYKRLLGREEPQPSGDEAWQ